jgi:hypothetical protein
MFSTKSKEKKETYKISVLGSSDSGNGKKTSKIKQKNFFPSFSPTASHNPKLSTLLCPPLVQKTKLNHSFQRNNC